LKMVWIFCNESIAGEVMDILDNDGIAGYTVWQNVLGRDIRTGKTHWGNDVFPGKNWVFMIFCGDEDITGLKEKFKTFEENPYVRRAGIKVLMNNAEEII